MVVHGAPASAFCTACLSGEYPVPIVGERVRGQAVLEEYDAAETPTATVGP